MRGATIYLNQMLEEREREERRRARKAFAGAIVIAVLGFAAAMRERPPRTVIKNVLITVPGKTTERVTIVEKPVIVPAVPRRTRLRPWEWPSLDLTPITPSRPPLTRHLCVTPRQINFCGATVSDRVTVSNVGDAPIRITQIRFVSDRSASGFVMDAEDCKERKLVRGDLCTIFVMVHEAKDETLHLLIANDTGEMDTVRIESPTAAASPVSRVAAY